MAQQKEVPTQSFGLHQLKPKPGSRFKHFRFGIGEGSGGGQTALLRRVPKRGFGNKMFKVVYQVVSLSDIERVFKNQKEVTPESLKIHGLVRGRLPVKILGDGELSRAYKVSAHAFSESAKQKIEKAGGKAEAVKR